MSKSRMKIQLGRESESHQLTSILLIENPLNTEFPLWMKHWILPSIIEFSPELMDGPLVVFCLGCKFFRKINDGIVL